MSESDWLTEKFEISRPRLRAVAYRMLGSETEADDAVQETWLRVDRADAGSVENLSGWLTTIIARVCLDRLRARRLRPEDLVGDHMADEAIDITDDVDPEHQALLADSVGSALLVVLDMLAPPERVAFVLHDIFAVPFDEIASIVERSPDAARQLASRARRRLQGANAVPDLDRNLRREVVEAFLAAARAGDFDALLTVLDPDVRVRADAVARRAGDLEQAQGAVAVASWLARGARRAPVYLGLIDGAAGLIWAPRGRPSGFLDITIVDGKITECDVIADPDHVRRRDIVLLEEPRSSD
jgi:RNA polymerase sigma factor (sigma-70 family)